MVTLQKHHYTTNPTTKNTFIIAHIAILMAREGILVLLNIIIVRTKCVRLLAYGSNSYDNTGIIFMLRNGT